MNDQPALALLLLSPDIKLAKDLQAATGKFCKTPFTIYLTSSGEKFIEYGTKKPMAAVFIDETLSHPDSKDWIGKLRKSLSKELGNQTVPFFLLSNERDIEGNLRALRQGYSDLFAKPLDVNLVLQKLQIYLPANAFLKEDLLFSLDVQDSAEIAFRGTLVRASEYGATLVADRPFNPGDTMTLFSGMFSGNEGDCGASLVRVIRSIPQEQSGKFMTQLIFIGQARAMLSTIRLWLKKQYIQASGAVERNS